MPIDINQTGQPPATIRFTQPEGPFVVGTDHRPTESTGFLEHNPGDETIGVDHIEAGAHLADVQFEQPGPEVVHLEGFGPEDDDDVSSSGKHAAQTKVVTPPADDNLISTEGAETK
jgi:hypothetical protein